MIAGNRGIGILEIEQTKGQSTQKEREENAQLDTIESKDVCITVGQRVVIRRALGQARSTIRTS